MLSAVQPSSVSVDSKQPGVNGDFAAKAAAVKVVGEQEFVAGEGGAGLEVIQKPVRKRAPKKKREGASKGMRIRLLPDASQDVFFRRSAGSARWVWNWALHQQNEHYRLTGEHLSVEPLSRELTQLLNEDPEKDWLKQVPRTCLTQTLNDLGVAWKGFFDGLKGLRKDKPGKPQFKRRGGSTEGLGFQIDPRHKTVLNREEGILRLALVGPVKAVFSEPVPGIISSVAVKRKGEHWCASLSLIDVPAKAMIRKSEKARVFTDPLDSTGLAAMDASVVHGGVATSDGKTVFVMRTIAERARQDKKKAGKKRLQRQLARAQDHRLREMKLDPRKPIPKGTKIVKSHRQEALHRKVAAMDLRQVFARQDLIHKFTTELVRKHHAIVVETLSLIGMAQALSRGFRRRMHEACMGEILRQLKYKCALYGRSLIFVDRYFPSSKRCSNNECHRKNARLQLKDRAWTCPHCHTHHDRDANAAFNLWQEGWRLLRERAEKPVRPQASTSCNAFTTVGSTGIVRGGSPSRSGVSFPAAAEIPMKRKSSRKTLALPELHDRMDRACGTAG